MGWVDFKAMGIYSHKPLLVQNHLMGFLGWTGMFCRAAIQYRSTAKLSSSMKEQNIIGSIFMPIVINSSSNKINAVSTPL
jgi:hypothetical protein